MFFSAFSTRIISWLLNSFIIMERIILASKLIYPKMNDRRRLFVDDGNGVMQHAHEIFLFAIIVYMYNLSSTLIR